MPVKKAVMYGAGNIGRGFIGQLLSESGYYTTFIDINAEVVNALRERRDYPLRILSGNIHTDLTVKNITAVSGHETEQVARAIADAELMATAVGANILPRIAAPIAAGLLQRFARGGAPLDILVCENLADAGPYLRGLILEHLPQESHHWFMNNVGLVETSIGRMVPLQTEELRDGDPLRVCVEEYSALPVDSCAFKAGIPELKGIVPFSPFLFYVERKLYIHNMGHALAAYCGDYLGLTYIWEAMETPAIRDIVQNAMLSCADALSLCYNADRQELYAHVEDLLRRFGNRQLGDTVYRVGRDLPRKLAEKDRLAGALRLCQRKNISPMGVMLGIALALRFSGETRPLSPERTLTELCGIGGDEPAYAGILGMYRLACQKEPFEKILKGFSSTFN